MSEPIGFTDDQCWAIKSRAHAEGVKSLSVDDLRRIIRAMNTVRDGFPIGTVMRNPDTGIVAFRAELPCDMLDCTGMKPKPSWHWIDETGQQRHARTDDCLAAREIARWDVIYMPEVER